MSWRCGFRMNSYVEILTGTCHQLVPVMAGIEHSITSDPGHHSARRKGQMRCIFFVFFVFLQGMNTSFELDSPTPIYIYIYCDGPFNPVQRQFSGSILVVPATHTDPIASISHPHHIRPNICRVM